MFGALHEKEIEFDQGVTAAEARKILKNWKKENLRIEIGQIANAPVQIVLLT